MTPPRAAPKHVGVTSAPGRLKSATFRAPAPSSVGVDDPALSRALVAGDGQAFQALVEMETARVFRACYRVMGRVDEAEEVTQEAFVLAYRALGTFRGEGHPAAWLMRIATREAWRHVAERSRRRAMVTTLDEGAPALRSAAFDPVAEAIFAEERDRVRAAVGRLPEPYREVITLRFFGELSLLEICAATGRPEGTIKAQVHRAIQRLRVLLTETRP